MSPHFRASALDHVGGWDAWNVAEDADLGLRLARFGYRTQTFASSTYEDAPLRLDVWLRQRRRWLKGWMQTAIVATRDTGRIVPTLGPARSLVLALMLTSLVISPLCIVPLTALTLWQAIVSGPTQIHGPAEVAAATLWTSVFVMGSLSVVWTGYAGARARRLKTSWVGLLAFLPYQLLIGIAAWGALADLLHKPFHWHKTPHEAPEEAGLGREDGTV